MLMISTRPVVHTSRKHMACSASASGYGQWVWLRWPTKRHYLRRSWTVTNDSKHIQASFSLIPTDWLCLWVAHMPRSWDPAIFVMTTDRPTNQPTNQPTDRQIDYFTPMHARGVIIANLLYLWYMYVCMYVCMYMCTCTNIMLYTCI